MVGELAPAVSAKGEGLRPGSCGEMRTEGKMAISAVSVHGLVLS